ncbi:restriction endonuclease subunit S [Candidatus Magnetominusculus xianensis]|uniref:Type I restriction modification DNA specificity domain-containing protein n=1 Tax=Candidatus Magnetominusculus xianensis TaxID=1748249 RepID=A0ABR5SHR5_9BACT|nr:restriction endonuclease subunit S [Candidatus Magnetominusculus xianensis]KWT91774.1 hypothetical protein ASN18_0764 [Candidatus Magnetominusculus xianensis]MBF0404850.1 restriction endonuclease subunit S [Nitrospirota bacterium]
MANYLSRFKETEIGLIPDDWDVKPADLIIDIFGGGTPKTTVDEYWGGNIPWLSVVDFGDDSRYVYQTEKKITFAGLENSSAKILDKGMLVISARGTVGELAQLEVPMAFNQSCYGLKAKNGISNDYLYYVLKQSVYDFKQKSHGAIFDTITRDTFKNIYVPIPTLKEQLQIAEILSSLDDKIELNRKITANLEILASALFKKWFIDIGDELPEGWRHGMMSDICSFNPAYSLKRTQTAPYAEMKDLPDLGASIKSFIYRDFTSGSKFTNGDTLLARITPCLENGKTGFVNFLSDNEVGWGSTEFIVMHPREKEFSEFIYFIARTESFREHAIQSMSGTSGRQRVQVNSLIKYPVVIPSENMISRFHMFTKIFFDQIVFNYNQTQTLIQIRDSLLPRLMSGKIRVKS